MIRKLGTVDAPAEVVHRIFLDVESWGSWMPNVRSSRILRRFEGGLVAELVQKRGPLLQYEFLTHSSGYLQRQLKGQLKKWEGDWRFLPAPSGRGSVISCKIDLELGFVGLFVSKGMVQRSIDKAFVRILEATRSRARLEASAKVVVEGDRPKEPDSRIQAFATPTELEIWIGDRKYIARAED